MKCIFCEQEASASKSVEHIIPESFGNSTAILPKGVVCDKCNNYFARKVEGHFLNSDAIRKLRQELEIENKEGNLIKSYDYPRVGKEYVKQISNEKFLIYTKEDKTNEELAGLVWEYQKYQETTDEALLIPNEITARLLAQIAIEAFVYRCGSTNDVCEYVVNDLAFKPLREYARYGNRKIWDYTARRIYSRNEAYNGDPFSSINWEYDFLFLGSGEVYFVIVLYGIEYAINILIPSKSGYEEWLVKNDNQSPLYINPVIRENELSQYAETMYTESEKEFRNLSRKKE